MKYKPFLYDGIVRIGKHSIIGTNTIIHPNVIVGAFAATGSNTLVLKDLEPMGIYVGSPARKISSRRKEEIEQLEIKLIEEFYGCAPNGIKS